MQIRSINRSTTKIVYRQKMTIRDVINMCHSVYLFDRSQWVNLTDGYFINPETGIVATAEHIYPSIKLGTKIDGTMICKRRKFNDSMDEQEAASGWELRRVQLLPKSTPKQPKNLRLAQ